MKRLCLFLIAVVIPALCAAQRSLELYYIAHDHFESSLTEMIELTRRNARYDDSRTVVCYLSNGNTPVFFKISPEDERAFQEFRTILNEQTSHSVYPDVDRLMIIDIFSEGRFLPTKGFDSYDKVILNFFINQSFVQMDYCDAVIGRLFWAMDLSSMPKNKLEINIFHHPEDLGDYSDEKMFGRKNYLGGFEPLVDSY